MDHRVVAAAESLASTAGSARSTGRKTAHEKGRVKLRFLYPVPPNHIEGDVPEGWIRRLAIGVSREAGKTMKVVGEANQQRMNRSRAAILKQAADAVSVGAQRAAQRGAFSRRADSNSLRRPLLALRTAAALPLGATLAARTIRSVAPGRGSVALRGRNLALRHR